MRKLVFVHGIAQQGKSAELLHSEWFDALNNGFKKIGKTPGSEAKVPFYGKDLYDLSVRSASIQIDMRNGGGTLDHPDYLARNDAFEVFIKEVEQEALQKKHFSDLLARTNTQSSHPDTEKRRGSKDDSELRSIQNTRVVRQLVQVIDSKAPSISEFTIRHALREVFLYVTDNEVRKKVDATVRKTLTQEPTTLVAHSLGTVVAYNVLSELGDASGLDINLVSLGSPLGIKAISRKLNGIPKVPRNVAFWFNAFDPRDIVALNPLASPAFFGYKPKCFEKSSTIDNFTENKHGIAGYLSDHLVASMIDKTLRL